MSITVYLGHAKENLNALGRMLAHRFTLSTTQKVIVISFSASVIIVGVLSRYLRRKKQVADPTQFRRNYFSSKRSRVSGLRSPNGDVGSTTSSGRRSYYGDKLGRPNSIVVSGKASIASGSLASTGLPIPEGLETANLTPQQLGVMGAVDVSYINYCQDLVDGSKMFASKESQPCVRNTFTIIESKQSKTGRILYGDSVRIQSCQSNTPPLYLRCYPYYTNNLGEPLQVSLSHKNDFHSLFKILHWNPQNRVETDGTNIKIYSRIIIKHLASGLNLTVESNKLVPTLTEPAFVVSCNLYKDSHRMETARNFWRIKGSFEQNLK